MELQHPLRVVTPTVDGDVLMVLARATSEFTPPQIHALLGQWSVDGVRKALDRLTSQGIVVHRTAGRAGLYRLNDDHLAAPAIVTLASQRDELLQRLRERFDEWHPPVDYAAMFGSAARGDMRTNSDIDLFVVRPDSVDPDDGLWGIQVSRLERDVTAWTGNDTRVLEYSATELRSGITGDDIVLHDIARDGIRLAGAPGYLHPQRARRGER